MGVGTVRNASLFVIDYHFFNAPHLSMSLTLFILYSIVSHVFTMYWSILYIELYYCSATIPMEFTSYKLEIKVMIEIPFEEC